MVQQTLTNITITIANNLQQKWQQYNITAETLMQLSFSIWDLMLAFFNQVFFFYNEINAQFKLTHTFFALFMQLLSALENFSKYMIDSFYNSDWLYMVAKNLIVVIVDFLKVLYYQIPSTDEIQQKWTQMNEQYKLTDTAIVLFTQSLSVLENVSGYLVRAVNNSDWIFAVAKNIMFYIVDFVEDLLNQITSSNEMQQNWTQMNEQYKLITETASALFTRSQSAVENISGYLVRTFNNSDWIFAIASNLIVVIVDFAKDLPNQIPPPHEMQQKWSQLNEQYQVTNTVVALFTQFLSALESIYVHLTRVYNNSGWIFVVARNQMVALTDTTIDILRKLKTLLEFLINVFNYILPPEKRGDQIPDWLYLGGYFVILVVLLIACIRNLGPRGKTMKAPGKPNMVISRAAFEDNPRKYFANHRRKR